MSNFVAVARVAEIAPGSGKTVQAVSKAVALFKVDGKLCAIENTCPHRGGPLGEGELEGTVVTCPWHGWRFDVVTGISPVNPSATVITIPCKVEGDQVWVDV